MSDPHRYRIRPANPGAHLYEVGLEIAEPDAAGQVLSMPAWIPGSYLVREFARHVVSIRAESDGRAVALTKLDSSTWRADACNAPLTVVAEIYACDPSVRGAHLDTTHAYFNGTCVFLRVHGQQDRACEVLIEPPPAPLGKRWRVATAMRRRDAKVYGFGTYHADDYDELIDHPVEIGNLHIGEFDVGDVPHVIALRGYLGNADIARICSDLTKVCEQHRRLLGKPENLDRYLFLINVVHAGYGGLEHRWSSSNVCSREDLPQRGTARVTDRYRKFLGLCSHEYFHLWNVKRMKPEMFTPYDLGRESHTGLLWVFEGITSYYDDLALIRSGLISEESYLELIARTITRVIRARGRHRQTVEESSFDAWSKFYKQDAYSSNVIVSYYTKGALIALGLDLTLRRETDGSCTLDDVMRECWRRFGETGAGMPERGLEDVAEAVSGLELGDFFDRYVRGTADLPLEILFRHVGIELLMRSATGKADSGGKAASEDKLIATWLGATLTSRNVFSTVHSDSPAEQAGITAGDEAVALNEHKLTAKGLDEMLRAHHPGDEVIVRVFRDDELLSLPVRLVEPPDDTCYLVIEGDAPVHTEANRLHWLSGGGDLADRTAAT